MPFTEFWPRYLGAHRDPRTRTLHVAGTIAGTALVAAAIDLRKPWLAAAGLAAGYGPAWFSHAFIEHNKPETFHAPLASIAADYVMAYHVVRGTIDQHTAPARIEK
ncbi:MAG: Mpo1-like protein [Candidatus Baltobacteraceae bacterium]